MQTAKDILDAFHRLPPEERRVVADSVLETDNDIWDEQIRADADSGRLDELFADDIAAFKAGKCRKL